MGVMTIKKKVLIEVKDLRKVFRLGKEKVVAINKMDFEINEGEICCILGTSGSGKSTLLNMMAGLEKPTKGYVKISGHEVTKMNEKKLATFRQKYVGFIFQSYNLMNTLTAVENVSLPLVFRRTPRAKRDKEAKDLLKAVGLKSHMHHRPTQMSGGQQQRVGIARSFVGSPNVIFADEPTGNLDSKTSEEVLLLMEEIVRKKNQALVIVTHDRSVTKYADKIINVLDGNIEKIEVIDQSERKIMVKEKLKLKEEEKKKKKALKKEEKKVKSKDIKQKDKSKEIKTKKTEDIKNESEKTV